MDEKVLGSTVRIDMTTHVLATGALVAPSSAFAAADFRVYKDGSASEKTTTNGITVTSPFDSITGKHLIEIDTSNATGDSGFWAAGSEYRVELHSAKTIDSILQNGVTVGRFRLVSADVFRSDGYTAPANSTIADAYALLQLTDADVALIKSAIDALSAMLPNTDFLAGAATDAGAAVLDTATQAILNNIPTNSELTTALAAADDAVLAAISALNNLSAAQVNAELLDVLSVDTFAELSAPPSASSSLKDKLVYLFMWARNKATQTTTERKLYADDGTTVVSTESVSDTGGTFTKGEAS